MLTSPYVGVVVLTLNTNARHACTQSKCRIARSADVLNIYITCAWNVMTPSRDETHILHGSHNHTTYNFFVLAVSL